MNFNELATFNFYQWEYMHRGYYHFDAPIDIEVPYVPFEHKSPTDTQFIDDGKAPSLFKTISNIFLPVPKIEKEIEIKEREVTAHYLPFEDKPTLIGLSLSFPKGIEILPSRNRTFLDMLSFSQHLLSFEVIGDFENITIQFVCSTEDVSRVESHFKAYFPNAFIRKVEVTDFGFAIEKDIAIADFGLNDEHVRSITAADSFAIDPLTSVIATMESLQQDDVVVFQILFKGITSPLAKDITYAVSDGAGGSFFADAPEMPNCAKEKISNPLFSVVMRIATQGNTDYRSQYLAQELARSITSISTSEYNKLIPLSNEGYDYDFHHYNLHHRLSNRLGFILNSKELNTFLHYPNKTIVSRKLGLGNDKSKRQKDTSKKGVYLGENIHQKTSSPVHLDIELRLSHTHILGATGVGKSTLLANMILEDIKQGLGCALFDPHGDICDDVLKRIPENRINDVVLINPSDIEFPVGFNLLEAKTEAQKIVLSSDIVSAFKRHATAWGDTMTSVLQNAVNTILENADGGTLIELKRFLIEDKFRNSFLKNIDDPSIHYYWNNEYPMVKKRIAPLLTRIDTFLRPKLVRYMLAQKKGVNITECLADNKIVLLKFSQGLIGEENSYLLGSLFLAKFNQAALARQNQGREERQPYMLYLDEFQNFITPSIERILSGARKYKLGITIAHQELGQIQDTSLLNSVLSNPKTRICFRLGDADAKRLESGFSYFEQSDLQSLDRGEAIMRIGSSANDFNLSTKKLSEVSTDYTDKIIASVREKYATSKAVVEELLIAMLPYQKRINKKDNIIEKSKQETKDNEIIIKKESKEKIKYDEKDENSKSDVEVEKEKYLKQLEKRETITKHRSLQNYIEKLATQRGFKTVIEEPTVNGGKVDIGLTKNEIRIAIEISITNTKVYETKNILKCIESGYSHIVMLCVSAVHLKNIKNHLEKEVPKVEFKTIHFILENEIVDFLDGFYQLPKDTSKRIQGYRVKTSYRNEIGSTKINKQQELTNIILSSMSSKKTKK